MSRPELVCRDERRRHNLRKFVKENEADQELNGFDYLEIDNIEQTLLRIYLLRKASVNNFADIFQDDEQVELLQRHFIFEGGRRIAGREIRPVNIALEITDEGLDDYLLLEVNRPGDFSNYTLKFVNIENEQITDEPYPGFDRRYASLEFNFKSDCPSDLDCKTSLECPKPKIPEPDINYLAKDYGSFRQVLLGRLSQTLPAWRENHIPDLGIMLVELMAYAGDYLSYYQDAVATESYLDTARRRISVRRHAKLVDYGMHEGNNARSWIQIQVSGDLPDLNPADIFFITNFADGFERGKVVKPEELAAIPESRYQVFEPLGISETKITFYKAHNEIEIHTWGDADCCLPRGATSATLKDAWATPGPEQNQEQTTNDTDAETEHDPDCETDMPETEPERQLKLEIGDFLLFEEALGPDTGEPEDANLKNRHVVRLTSVKRRIDELEKLPVLEIEWSVHDALPFPLCISTIGSPPKCDAHEKVSVARANVILADHGRRVPDENLGLVEWQESDIHCLREGRPSDQNDIPKPFKPQLERGPLTHAEELPPENTPASQMLVQDPRRATPQIRLTGIQTGPLQTDDPEWQSVGDLLRSHEDDQHFVVEMDGNGIGHLRFGDNELGKRPAAGTRFQATYRIGNGPGGNVGAGRITHMVMPDTISGITVDVHNPLPASGGTLAEPLSEVKLYAPTTFRKRLERAITADDYIEIAMRHPAVQKAAASFRWTGSWFEVVVAVDLFATSEDKNELLKQIRQYLESFRRTGHDLRVKLAEFVSLDIVMEVCLLPSYLRGHVKAELLQVFGNGILPDGRLGFFHPDRLTFNQPVRVSKMVAEAQKIAGVESIAVTRLERLFEGPNGELEAQILPIGPLEIARLDNDPSFPENGRLELKIKGGR